MECGHVCMLSCAGVVCVSLQGELLALRKDCCGEGLTAKDVQEKVEKVGVMRGW